MVFKPWKVPINYSVALHPTLKLFALLEVQSGRPLRVVSRALITARNSSCSLNHGGADTLQAKCAAFLSSTYILLMLVPLK